MSLDRAEEPGNGIRLNHSRSLAWRPPPWSEVGRDLHFLTPFSDTQLAAQFGGDYASGKPRWQSKGKAMHSASIPMNLGVDDLADGSLAQRPDEDLLRIETHHRLMNTFAILGSCLQQERNTADPSRRMALARSVRMIVAYSRLHRCLALVTQRRQVALGEYVTSVDHKRISVMYFLLGLMMLVCGFSDAIMMRTQLALAAGAARGYLPPERYDQIFSAHGTIMIFFVAIRFVVGLMHFAMPLQPSVRDVAFPVLNKVSFWLTAAGVLLVNLSLFIGEFARNGWLAYPPPREFAYSPGVGVDHYFLSLQISGLGTLLSGINLTTTLLKLRAPGMSYMCMPIFCWTSLASNLLIVAAFAVLTATFAILLLDRYCGFHFFTSEAGGSPMMYINLIWIWAARQSTSSSCRPSGFSPRSSPLSPANCSSGTAPSSWRPW